MNADIFIPVRLASSRLPKKAMKEIKGKSIIKYLIERLETTTKIRNIIVCTTVSKSDDELVAFLKQEKITYFRGSENDILDRYLEASKKYETDFIVNVEGDDIYTDPICVDRIVLEFQKTNADYIDIAKMPFGLSPCGIKPNAIEKICSIKKSNNTETGYKRFFTETDLFDVHHIKLEHELRFPKYTRLSLDYQEDFILAKEIFSELGNNFHKEDLLKLFKRKPYLLNITKNLDVLYNEHYNQNIVDISLKDI